MSSNNAVCRKCRREGDKLFLKGERCLSPKCSFTKRSYAPGARGQHRPGKLSDYGVQLRAKQGAKAIYKVREKQFKNYYEKASKTKEASGSKLLQLLETRLDNVVYKLGFSQSVRQARQMVRHKKFKVNNKIVDIPSYNVEINEKIEPKNKEGIKLSKNEVPVWLKLDKGNLSGELVKLPAREEITAQINEDLIVEFYSR